MFDEPVDARHFEHELRLRRSLVMGTCLGARVLLSTGSRKALVMLLLQLGSRLLQGDCSSLLQATSSRMTLIAMLMVHRHV